MIEGVWGLNRGYVYAEGSGRGGRTRERDGVGATSEGSRGSRESQGQGAWLTKVSPEGGSDQLGQNCW